MESVYWLVETKGREDVDFQFKDKAAVIWCEHATMLTPNEWHYMKVSQKEFEKLQPEGEPSSRPPSTG